MGDRYVDTYTPGLPPGGLADLKTYGRTVHPSTLNANQFLVHSGILDGMDEGFGGDNSRPGEPVWASPAAGGRWDVWDGHHRALHALMNDRPVDVQWAGSHGARPHESETAHPDNPMRLSDRTVVHPGEEGEYVDVDDLVQAGKVSPAIQYTLDDGEDVVWHV